MCLFRNFLIDKRMKFAKKCTVLTISLIVLIVLFFIGLFFVNLKFKWINYYSEQDIKHDDKTIENTDSNLTKEEQYVNLSQMVEPLSVEI